MSFVGYNLQTDLTMVILTDLAAEPSGEGAALTIWKAILPTFTGGGPVAGADPAAPVGHEHEQKNAAPRSEQPIEEGPGVYGMGGGPSLASALVL